MKKKIEGTGFTSVSDYVTFVLREMLSGIEMDDNDSKIKQKLRSLGYLG